MRSRMSPTGHVPLSDLPDRQSLLCASLGSCNKNILLNSSMNTHSAYSYIYTSIHTRPYSSPSVHMLFIHMSITIYLGTYALMNSCTHVLMYSCTFVLMYSSSQRIRYCYRLASMSTKKHLGLYTVHIWSRK